MSASPSSPNRRPPRRRRDEPQDAVRFVKPRRAQGRGSASAARKWDVALGVIALLSLVLVGVILRTLWRWWTGPLNAFPTPVAQAQQATPDLTAIAALPTAMPNAPIPPHPWDGHSRVTLLLMGVDDRVWDPTWGAPRADTLILLTMDPQTKTAGMLSIPRDLFVEVPGFGMQKINTAYPIGEANFGEWGGATLTVRTVERLLDIEIPYFAVVDFRAFILFVDAIHGVKVDIPETLLVGIERADGRVMKRIKPGVQVLNGEMALAYARNRAKPVQGLDGDFGRMYRQQIVLMGVLNRLKEPRVWADLLMQAPFLYRELSQSLRTNVSPQQAVAWAQVAIQIPKERIFMAEIGHGQTQADMYNGMYILRPRPDAIAELRQRLFSLPQPTAAPPAATPTPAATAPPDTAPGAPPTLGPTPTPSLEQALREGSTFALTNATLVSGLACRTAAALHEQGFRVVALDDTNTLREKTLLEVYADRQATFAYLVAWLGLDPVKDAHRIRFMPVGSGPADFRIVLGADWAAQRGPALPTECYQP